MSKNGGVLHTGTRGTLAATELFFDRVCFRVRVVFENSAPLEAECGVFLKKSLIISLRTILMVKSGQHWLNLTGLGLN